MLEMVGGQIDGREKGGRGGGGKMGLCVFVCVLQGHHVSVISRAQLKLMSYFLSFIELFLRWCNFHRQIILSRSCDETLCSASNCFCLFICLFVKNLFHSHKLSN